MRYWKITLDLTAVLGTYVRAADETEARKIAESIEPDEMHELTSRIDGDPEVEEIDEADAREVGLLEDDQ